MHDHYCTSPHQNAPVNNDAGWHDSWLLPYRLVLDFSRVHNGSIGPSPHSVFLRNQRTTTSRSSHWLTRFSFSGLKLDDFPDSRDHHYLLFIISGRPFLSVPFLLKETLAPFYPSNRNNLSSRYTLHFSFRANCTLPGRGIYNSGESKGALATIPDTREQISYLSVPSDFEGKKKEKRKKKSN